MRQILTVALILPALLTTAAAAKPEFEVASIKVNPPESGFHFATPSLTGGPGSPDPGLFRCSKCTLATLIGAAFGLQNYQFPGRTALGDRSFDIAARVPAGATADDFRQMLQSLLQDRFALEYHFTEKKLRGYHLAIAKTGAKLKESGDRATPRTTGQQWPGHSGEAHQGLIAFGGSARFRNDHQTAAQIAQLLSDQLGLPVDDQTGLTGQYDVALTWSGDTGHSGNHFGGGDWGGASHDHGGGAASGPGGADGPGLFDALREQLGLQLVPAAEAVARLFVLDHADPLPTAN